MTYDSSRHIVLQKDSQYNSSHEHRRDLNPTKAEVERERPSPRADQVIGIPQPTQQRRTAHEHHIVYRTSRVLVSCSNNKQTKSWKS